MNDCIFCKIAKKEIPSHTVYEDKNVYAFLDINPLTKGHTLVIPKKHIVDIFEMSEEDASKIFSVIPKISKILEENLNMIGLNIINNNKPPYQDILHYHLHLIPRYEDDKLIIEGENKNFTQDQLTQLAIKFKEKKL